MNYAIRERNIGFIWSGLSDLSHIIQAGSLGYAAVVYGNNIIYYGLWYEAYPAAAVQCTSGSTASGHAVESYVYSATLVGGSSGQWYSFVKDNTNGNICQPTQPFSNSLVPIDAEFQAERPCLATWYGSCISRASLPYFGSYNPEGRMYYNNAVRGLFCNGCNQVVTQHQMENPISNGINNIQNSAITDTGTNWGKFTNTWLSSQNT